MLELEVDGEDAAIDAFLPRCWKLKSMSPCNYYLDLSLVRSVSYPS